MKPSFGLPVCYGARTIRRALDSIVGPSRVDGEPSVVDDASSDATVQVLHVMIQAAALTRSQSQKLACYRSLPGHCRLEVGATRFQPLRAALQQKLRPLGSLRERSSLC